MGQDPYAGTGGFTPYQPDATPDGEPSDGPADAPADSTPAPFVPYGGAPQVPYGQTAYGVPAPITTRSNHRWVAWLVGLSVVIATCGGGVGGILGIFTGDDGSGSGTDQQVAPVDEQQMLVDLSANDLAADQCLIGAGFDPSSGDPLTNIEVVPCTTVHDAQVLAVNVLDSEEAAAYDFDDTGQIRVNCNRFFTDAQNRLFRGDEYVLLAFTQSRTPVTGDKVACIVVRGDGGPLHGSLP